MTMTLQEAIEEVKAMDLVDVPLWNAEEVRRTQGPNDLATIAAILNAVVSGDLIPAEDARLAVAVALRLKL